VGYTYRGKDVLEAENPNSVGMTGLLGWGGAHRALAECDLLLLLGTDFPYREFLATDATIVQIDDEPAHLGRRAKVDVPWWVTSATRCGACCRACHSAPTARFSRRHWTIIATRSTGSSPTFKGGLPSVLLIAKAGARGQPGLRSIDVFTCRSHPFGRSFLPPD
jgi:hypothetical protein